MAQILHFEQYFTLLGGEVTNSTNLELMGMGDEERFMPFHMFGIKLNDIDTQLPLVAQIDRRLAEYQTIHEKVISQLEAQFPNQTIEVSFDFPPEVRVPCEQYLLYFVQFLKDLGVDATAELNHVAGEVLFAVTPTDKDTALDNIRAALETYLQLPSSPIADNTISEVAIQRLAANVDHLRGQVRLGNAEIQMKDATIEAQQTTIRLLRGSVLLESVKDVTPSKNDDKESFLGDTVALKAFNYKGVELNYPEIFRKLRRLFKKDKPQIR